MKTKILSFIITLFTWLVAPSALAQTEPDSSLWKSINKQWGPIQNVFGGRPSDPRAIAALIIKILVGFVGIVYIVVIVYGGFLWMTAGGNTDQVDKAKNTIKHGAIGVAVILLAYSITRFIVLALGCSASSQGAMCLFFHNLI